MIQNLLCLLDSTKIVFSRASNKDSNDWSLYMYDISSKNITKLITSEDNKYYFIEDWIANTKKEWIVFDDEQIKTPGHLWKVKPDGTELTQLTFGDDTDESPSFCKKGNWIVFNRRYKNGGANLYKIKIDGSSLTQLTFLQDNINTIGVHPEWSYDCSKIYFGIIPIDGTVNDIEVYEINSDGTGLKRITNNNTYDGATIDNPNDSFLYFIHGSPQSIYKMDKNGQNITPFLSGYNECLRFNSDGSKLLTLDSDYPNPIYLINMEDLSSKKITNSNI